MPTWTVNHWVPPCAGLYRVEQFTHIILTHPPAAPADETVLSLILWMRKPSLREVQGACPRSHSWPLAEWGWDPGLCDSELALWAVLVVLTELGSEKVIKRKDPQRNFQPCKRPVEFRHLFSRDGSWSAMVQPCFPQGNLVLPFVAICCF